MVTMLFRSSPDHSIVRIAEKKTDTHNREIIIYVDRVPSTVTLMYFSTDDSHHSRDARSANINVQNTNLGMRRLRAKLDSSHTCFPIEARVKASWDETVLFPTPPFPDNTKRVCLMFAIRWRIAAAATHYHSCED